MCKPLSAILGLQKFFWLCRQKSMLLKLMFGSGVVNSLDWLSTDWSISWLNLRSSIRRHSLHCLPPITVQKWYFLFPPWYIKRLLVPSSFTACIWADAFDFRVSTFLNRERAHDSNHTQRIHEHITSRYPNLSRFKYDNEPYSFLSGDSSQNNFGSTTMSIEQRTYAVIVRSYFCDNFPWSSRKMHDFRTSEES